MSEFLNTVSLVGGFLFSVFMVGLICYATIDAIFDMYIKKKFGAQPKDEQVEDDNYYPYN